MQEIIPDTESHLKEGFEIVYASSRYHWRQWLFENHLSKKAVWLVIYKKKSNNPSVYNKETVEEALCYGWIDSKPNKKDSVSYNQFFAKSNPKNNRSKINKNLADKLIKESKMHTSGFALKEIAKKSGTWDALNQVDNLESPKDLLNALEKFSEALNNWNNFSPSFERGILEWISTAKTENTRAKRINETVTKAENNSPILWVNKIKKK